MYFGQDLTKVANRPALCKVKFLALNFTIYLWKFFLSPSLHACKLKPRLTCYPFLAMLFCFHRDVWIDLKTEDRNLWIDSGKAVRMMTHP